MKAKQFTTLVLGTVLFTVIGASDVVRSQTVPKIGDETSEKIPEVSLSEPKTMTPAQLELHRKRSAKYSNGYPIVESDDKKGGLLDLPGTHTPKPAAFPIKTSDAILIGTIRTAEAFLTTDRSAIFSLFSLEIESVIENSGTNKVGSGENILAERSGGIIRFASGVTGLRGGWGLGLPQEDRKYLLFLKWDAEGQDYLVITGYCLDGGKVKPLDGENKWRDTMFFENYREFRDVDSNYLLQRLKTAMIESKNDGTPK